MDSDTGRPEGPDDRRQMAEVSEPLKNRTLEEQSFRSHVQRIPYTLKASIEICS